MSEFMPEPSRNLIGSVDLLDAINNPTWQREPHPFQYHVKSDWLIALIDEIAEAEYPYNTVVQRAAEQRLGIPQQPDSGSPLSVLVYNAQKFRDSDKLTAAGYKACTQEMLDEAYKNNQQVEWLNGDRLNLRDVGGTIFCFRPRKRVYGVAVLGHPVKIVSKKKTSVA